MREELEEIRGRLDVANEDNQKVAGLQLRIKEYEKILPTLEQDRHESQLMKKQLEFENVELAQRWNGANEQHALDQERVADLEDKLEDLQKRTNSTFLRSKDNLDNLDNLGNLDLELEKSARDEQQLQVASAPLHCTRLLTLTRYKKLSKLEAENLQLKASADNQGSKTTTLQQLLDQAHQKLEEREKSYLEIYQEKLSLESSLDSISQGDPVQRYTPHSVSDRNLIYRSDSTDVFRKTREKLDVERKRNAEPEAELSTAIFQLQAANNDCKLLNVLCWKQVKANTNLLH